MSNAVTTQNNCLSCATELSWQDGVYHCDACAVYYQKKAFCPKCEAECEKLQACGSVSYFCNQCNELKSKSSVRVEFIPQ